MRKTFPSKWHVALALGIPTQVACRRLCASTTVAAVTSCENISRTHHHIICTHTHTQSATVHLHTCFPLYPLRLSAHLHHQTYKSTVNSQVAEEPLGSPDRCPTAAAWAAVPGDHVVVPRYLRCFAQAQSTCDGKFSWNVKLKARKSCKKLPQIGRLVLRSTNSSLQAVAFEV